MAKNSYGRSLSWYLSFFGLPVAAFALMYIVVCDWENPNWGPQVKVERPSTAKETKEDESQSEQPNSREGAREESESDTQEQKTLPPYQMTTLILAVIGLFPYLGLLFKLTERLQITDKSIRQVRLFKSRRVIWDNLIECRDFLNYIHLIPTDRSSEMYIDYYQTFRRHDHFWRRITRKSRDVEANMMVGRRRGRVASCDLGLVPSLLFVAASAAMLILFRQRIILLGALSGMVLALAGAYIWITTRLSPRRWKSGGSVYVTLFALSLILPPAYFAQEIYREGKEAFMLFGALYFVGLLAGSGLVSVLLPSRKRR